MEKKCSGKKVILIIVIAFFLGMSFPNFLLSMQRINLAKKTDEIIKPFEDAAFEYVLNETNAVERYGYGKTPNLQCNMSRIDLINDRYADYSNLEEFEREVNTLELCVEVNNRATCVVCFEKDEDGHLVITKHFWE